MAMLAYAGVTMEWLIVLWLIVLLPIVGLPSIRDGS